jgi:putative transposase
VSSAGVINVNQVFYKIGVEHAFGHVLVISDGDQPGDTITITDLDGEILTERTRPAPGIRYVGNGRPSGTRPKNPRASPKS